MFIGQYTHSLDDKGRISVPTKFRSGLTKGCVVTRGLDRSLFLYSMSAWERLAEKLAALPLGKSDTRAFARLMLAGAMEAEIDGSGRIMIPLYLREYAGLSKRAVVTGLMDRIEIWDEETWNTYRSRTEAEGNDIAERLGEQGV
jgi:MraZ protein